MARCFFKAFAPLGLRECDGPPQRHHVVSRQRLKKELGPKRTHLMADGELVAAKRRLRDALGDSRNLVWVCKRHHDLWTNARLVVPRSAVPVSVDEFAAAHGLTWDVDRQFGPPLVGSGAVVGLRALEGGGGAASDE